MSVADLLLAAGLAAIERRIRARRTPPSSTTTQAQPTSQFHARFPHFNDPGVVRFRKFLDKAGLRANLIERLSGGEVTEQMVMSWRRGESRPTPRQQHALISYANDPHTFPRRARYTWQSTFGSEAVQ